MGNSARASTPITAASRCWRPMAVGGLEVRTRAGEWLKAPHVPGAFVCNIGDCLMRWTNDIYVSTPHRVVSPAGRERYSIAFFLDPEPRCRHRLPAGTARAPRVRPAMRRSVATPSCSSRLSPTYEKSRSRRGPAASEGEVAACGTRALANLPICPLAGRRRECAADGVGARRVAISSVNNTLTRTATAVAASGMHLASSRDRQTGWRCGIRNASL